MSRLLGGRDVDGSKGSVVAERSDPSRCSRSERVVRRIGLSGPQNRRHPFATDRDTHEHRQHCEKARGRGENAGKGEHDQGDGGQLGHDECRAAERHRHEQATEQDGKRHPRLRHAPRPAPPHTGILVTLAVRNSWFERGKPTTVCTTIKPERRVDPRGPTRCVATPWLPRTTRVSGSSAKTLNASGTPQQRRWPRRSAGDNPGVNHQLPYPERGAPLRHLP